MAEFELAGTTTIPVGGKQLTRNDVLRLFDLLDGEQNLGYHLIVASDPVLLHFLEHGELAAGQKIALPAGDVTNEFIEWLSPYFAWAFRRATTNMFRNVTPHEFEALVTSEWYMTPNDEWEAWSGVDSYVNMMGAELHELNKAKYVSDTQAAKYASYNRIWMLCNLKRERFALLLDKYAFELMQLAIKQFNNRKKDAAYELMGYAKSLRVSDDMMKALQDKEQEMLRIEKKNTTDKRKRETWMYVRIGLFAIYVLMRVATCTR